MVVVYDVIVGDDLRIVREVEYVLNPRPDDIPIASEHSFPCIPGLGFEYPIQEANQRFPILGAKFHAVEPGVFYQPRMADGLTEGGPVAVTLVHGKSYPTIVFTPVEIPQGIKD